MNFDRVLILVVGCIVVFCQQIRCNDGDNRRSVSELFDHFNRELFDINQRTAELAWDTNFRSFDTAKSVEAQQFVEFKLKWSIERCSELASFSNKFDELQARMFEIQCQRQPKFTGAQRREFYQLSDEVEKVFTETQICVPHSLDICSRPRELLNITFIKFQDEIQRIVVDETGHVSLQQSQNYPKFALQCYHGEPDLERMMSNDFELITSTTRPEVCHKNRNAIHHWIWESWRFAVGPRIKPLYLNLVELENEGASGAGYGDIGEIWKLEMDLDENVDVLMERLMGEVQPLYDLLVKFVKNLLNVDELPAHLLGWNANWATLYRDEIARKVFPNSKWSIDVKLALKHWSTRQILQRVEDFYTSTGLLRMTNEFWDQSLIGDNLNNFNCHGTAADMFTPRDYRIVACSVRTLYDLYVIVHEMGHIEQFMLAEKQPAEFRAGNSVIQETIGDAFFLAMMTPMHLNRLTLINDNLLFPSKSNSFDIELLMMMAFLKLPDIPFGFAFERFRYDLFAGHVSGEQANENFWKLTQKYQKISPSSSFDRRQLFDASAKFHLAANVPYARYFFANIVQFQVMKSLCMKTVYGSANISETAQTPMPLHKCDIYGSKRVGNLLKKTLSAGSSLTFKQILHKLTGSERISADALLEYFEPLKKWIEAFLQPKKID